MSESWEALKRDLSDAGVQSEFIDRIEAANAASPLRKERDEWKTKAETNGQEVARYRAHTIGSHLATRGFTGKPDALNIPADLDPLDREGVDKWAVDMGLIAPPEPSSEDQARAAELAAHDRMTAAGAGGVDQRPQGVQQRDEVLGAPSEAEFWKRAQAAGLVAPDAAVPHF